MTTTGIVQSKKILSTLIFTSIKRSPLLSFNSQDLISNSPYYLSYKSCDVSSEHWVLDQLIIH